jgi:D-methionine transport system substrate-binding protein
MMLRPFNKLITLSVLTLFLSACHRGVENQNVLRVGVTPVPAGEVVQLLVPVLAKENIQLKVVSFSDYIQPNLALAAKELEANLYQNVPFMEQFNHDHGSKFVSVAKAYLPPMGLYPGRAKSIAALRRNSSMAIPDDPTNSGRALILLQSAGLITLKANASAIAGPTDVATNPKHLQFRELEAAQLPRSLADVDAAVINANFALDAGLNPIKDALYHESPDSKYVNILAVNAGSENDPRIVALVRALHSDAVRDFLNTRYKGLVTPAF